MATHRLGKTAEGGYVVVEIGLRDVSGVGFDTVEHEPAVAHLELSITGEHYRKGDRKGDPSSAGQIRDDLTEITEPASGWTLAEIARLSELWDRWHLNGMRAGCAHVEPVYAPDQYGRIIPSLEQTPACPVTGYRYGHAWLVEYLPDEVLTELQQLDRDRSADLYAARGYDGNGRKV